jgi:hypothetical protein
MFTPEFVSNDQTEYVLVSNHNLSTDDHIHTSINFNLARIAFGKANLPKNFSKCKLIYDVRGQFIDDLKSKSIENDFAGLAIVEFIR